MFTEKCCNFCQFSLQYLARIRSPDVDPDQETKLMLIHTSMDPIEEGWREKQRQRSSRPFCGPIYSISCRASCFAIGRVERNGWIHPIYFPIRTIQNR